MLKMFHIEYEIPKIQFYIYNSFISIITINIFMSLLVQASEERQLFQIKQTYPERDMDFDREAQDVMRRRLHINERPKFKLESIPYECNIVGGGKRIIDPSDLYNTNVSQWWIQPYGVKFLNAEGEEVRALIVNSWEVSFSSTTNFSNGKVRANIFPSVMPLESIPVPGSSGFNNIPNNMVTVKWERFLDAVNTSDTRDWARISFFKLGVILRASNNMKDSNEQDLGKKYLVWEEDILDGGFASSINKKSSFVIHLQGGTHPSVVVANREAGVLKTETGSMVESCSWEPY
jgi:hypothetical protein